MHSQYRHATLIIVPPPALVSHWISEVQKIAGNALVLDSFATRKPGSFGRLPQVPQWKWSSVARGVVRTGLLSLSRLAMHCSQVERMENSYGTSLWVAEDPNISATSIQIALSVIHCLMPFSWKSIFPILPRKANDKRRCAFDWSNSSLAWGSTCFTCTESNHCNQAARMKNLLVKFNPEFCWMEASTLSTSLLVFPQTRCMPWRGSETMLAAGPVSKSQTSPNLSQQVIWF
jgi:hypothetical protein